MIGDLELAQAAVEVAPAQLEDRYQAVQPCTSLDKAQQDQVVDDGGDALDRQRNGGSDEIGRLGVEQHGNAARPAFVADGGEEAADPIGRTGGFHQAVEPIDGKSLHIAAGNGVEKLVADVVEDLFGR